MSGNELASVSRAVTDGSGDAFVPVGAHVTDAGVSYRVWAPDHSALSVIVGDGREPARRVVLEKEAEGYFSGVDLNGRTGDLYWYELGNSRVPDPASRFQPLGVEGPSQVVDPRRYRWTTADWKPPPLKGRVIYELHVGTFTQVGTFRGAIARLDALVELGVNAVELMPLADFIGDRNWGYDGVMLFAPHRRYGTPDELRAFVDAAHGRGLAVIVDVVYNHLGPVGNVLPRFSSSYLHASRNTGWGQALNFDGGNSEPVREFFLQNACMWFDEYRMDGLRLDALHAIEDASPVHIAAEIAAAAHARGGFVIGEDERNEAKLVSPRTEGGIGLDAVWSDDFHHSIRVALTRQNDAHFGSYDGTPDEWVTTLREGWLFRGQPFRLWQRPRGTAAGHLAPEKFVLCISNHDQVGNRPLGDRLHEIVPPAAYRAVSMLICLVPYTPMLFMGQEWAASTPFPFFSHHPGEIGKKIRSGRLSEYRSRNANYSDDMLARMPDPQAESTFLSAKLRWGERRSASHARVLALYRECLKLRAGTPVFQSAPRDQWSVGKGGGDLMAIRWLDPEGDWLLLFALGSSAKRTIDSDLARLRGGRSWQPVISSNETRFGGEETPAAAGGIPALISPGAMLWREA